MPAARLRLMVRMSRPRKLISPPVDGAVLAHVLHDGQRHGRLAAAGFADDVRPLRPALTVRLKSIDRRNLTGTGVVGNRDVLALENRNLLLFRHRCGFPLQSLSEISRMPSARRLRPSTSEEIANAGHSMAFMPIGPHDRDLVDHLAPVGIRRRQAEAQEAEQGNGDGDIAQAQAGIDDQRPAGVGQELHHHDVEAATSPRTSAAAI